MVKILARGEALTQLRPAIDEITSRLKLEYYEIDRNLRPEGRCSSSKPKPT
jgi:hypothetical protein